MKAAHNVLAAEDTPCVCASHLRTGTRLPQPVSCVRTVTRFLLLIHLARRGGTYVMNIPIEKQVDTSQEEQRARRKGRDMAILNIATRRERSMKHVYIVVIVQTVYPKTAHSFTNAIYFWASAARQQPGNALCFIETTNATKRATGGSHSAHLMKTRFQIHQHHSFHIHQHHSFQMINRGGTFSCQSQLMAVGFHI